MLLSTTGDMIGGHVFDGGLTSSELSMVVVSGLPAA